MSEDVRSRIEQLKRGSFKQDMRQIVAKQDKINAPTNSFQPISNKRKTGNQPRTNSSPPLESFAAQPAPEFSAIESMFVADSRPMSSNGNISMDDYQPKFDENRLKDEMRKKIQSQYKVKVGDQPEEREEIPRYKNEMEEVRESKEPQVNYYHIKQIIQEMVKEETEKVISNVLDSYMSKIGKNKPERVYEVVDNKKGIISIKGIQYKLSKI